MRHDNDVKAGDEKKSAVKPRLQAGRKNAENIRQVEAISEVQAAEPQHSETCQDQDKQEEKEPETVPS